MGHLLLTCEILDFDLVKSLLDVTVLLVRPFGVKLSSLKATTSTMSGKDETKQQDAESSSILDKLIPRVKAEDDEEEEDEEDLVDPAVEIKESCADSSACIKYKTRLDECNERVSSKSGETEETCMEEILDFYHCMDHCAADKIFAKLK